MVATSGEGSIESRRKGGTGDSAMSEASGVVRGGGVKEREDPRAGASGAEYTEHG